MWKPALGLLLALMTCACGVVGWVEYHAIGATKIIPPATAKRGTPVTVDLEYADGSDWALASSSAQVDEAKKQVTITTMMQTTRTIGGVSSNDPRRFKSQVQFTPQATGNYTLLSPNAFYNETAQLTVTE